MKSSYVHVMLMLLLLIQMFIIYLKDTVLRIYLSVLMCSAHCYDRASNVKKVAKEIQSTEPQALFLQCYGHSLHLAVSTR